jgi:hypothetical protein
MERANTLRGGRARARPKAALRCQEPVETIYLDDILDTTAKGIWVRMKDGRLAWLPRDQTQLMPGRAIIPSWLHRKLYPEGGGNGRT